MPRVGLVQVALRRPSGDPVQEPRFLQVGHTPTEPAFGLAQEVCLHAALRPVKVLVVPGEREVAPVDYAPHVPLRMVNAAGAGFASHEAEALNCLS
eukprot:9757156-Alexandrium_andersonii.AAC.1